MRSLSQDNSCGFTLVELVVIIILLGILSALAAPRFFDSSHFRERGLFDELVSAVRYGQKMAVATGCPVRIQIDAAGYTLLRPSPTCGSGTFIALGGDHPITTGAAGGVTLSSTDSPVEFDAMGRALVAGAPSDVTVTVGGRSFQIIGETGYVDTP